MIDEGNDTTLHYTSIPNHCAANVLPTPETFLIFKIPITRYTAHHVHASHPTLICSRVYYKK